MPDYLLIDDFSSAGPRSGFTRNQTGDANVVDGVLRMYGNSQMNYERSGGVWGPSETYYQYLVFSLSGGYPIHPTFRLALTAEAVSAQAEHPNFNSTTISFPISPQMYIGAPDASWIIVPLTMFTDPVAGAFDPEAYYVTGFQIGVIDNESPVTIDDVMFAVPAPGAAALIGLAGLITGRRREA